ncbi:hypothetical protein YWIDRAFT_08067 [Streptomyces sp. SceaMP-e96]|nr:hypothetical protein YWIDRAFT_08067 [Streptomyces sp. SceaMP-e96]
MLPATRWDVWTRGTCSPASPASHIKRRPWLSSRARCGPAWRTVGITWRGSHESGRAWRRSGIALRPHGALRTTARIWSWSAPGSMLSPRACPWSLRLEAATAGFGMAGPSTSFPSAGVATRGGRGCCVPATPFRWPLGCGGTGRIFGRAGRLMSCCGCRDSCHLSGGPRCSPVSLSGRWAVPTRARVPAREKIRVFPGCRRPTPGTCSCRGHRSEVSTRSATFTTSNGAPSTGKAVSVLRRAVRTSCFP